MGTRLRTVALGLTLAGATLAATGGVAAAGTDTQHRRPGPTPAPAIAWTPCDRTPELDCATITVPLDWAKPNGPTTTVALVRRKALDPGARLGTLVYNPGGPGVSGVGLVTAVPQLFSPDIHRRYDIVGFDPRGVGASHAVTCDPAVFAKPYPVEPTSPAELDALRRHNRELGESCRRLTGPVFDHLDTASVARDVDAIRAGLGEPRLNYFGLSYGTQIGQQYAELFPNRVGRMVLDSNVDHSQHAQSYHANTARAAEDAFGGFTAWCDRSTACALHGSDAGATFAALRARADRGQLSPPGAPTQKLDGPSLTGLAFVALYRPDWAGLADLLRALRDGTPPGPAAQAFLQFTGAFNDPAIRSAFQAISCQDWSVSVRDYQQLASYRRLNNRLAPHLRTSLGWSATITCEGWPAPVTNPQHRLHLRGVAPILLLNGLHDPATPHSSAVSVQRQLPGSVLVTYEGYGHAAYGRSTCITGPTDRYLLTGAVPNRGLRCPAVEPSAA